MAWRLPESVRQSAVMFLATYLKSIPWNVKTETVVLTVTAEYLHLTIRQSNRVQLESPHFPIVWDGLPEPKVELVDITDLYRRVLDCSG